MYEKNKIKRRFYECFNGSTSFYRGIIPGDRALEVRGAQRK